MRWLRACYWMLIRFLTRFRYRVRVEGLEKLRDLRGPTLVMPNHPGLIDPPLVLANVRLPVSSGRRSPRACTASRSFTRSCG